MLLGRGFHLGDMGIKDELGCEQSLHMKHFDRDMLPSKAVAATEPSPSFALPLKPIGISCCTRFASGFGFWAQATAATTTTYLAEATFTTPCASLIHFETITSHRHCAQERR
jgi:hypothetical protein